MNKTEQQISTARGMFEAMRHQRDKANAGLEAAQAEIKRLRKQCNLAENRIDLIRQNYDRWDGNTSTVAPLLSAVEIALAPNAFEVTA